jgi:hexosaminidase
MSFKNTLTAFFSIILSVGLSTGSMAQSRIIPQPNKMVILKGAYLLKANAVIGVDKESEVTGLYLQNYLAQNYKLHLQLKIYPQIPVNTAIRLISTSADTGAYNLSINTTGVKITGKGAGVFYGVQSLIQLLPDAGPAPLRLAACNITDAPRFKWRGLSLDVSRHFFTVDEVKKYIDVMAHYKLNVFHWHLTDDEGWRIQIDKYPRLTEYGARITFYEKQGKFRKLDNLIDGGGRDGFYTKDDIREVLKYAAERFVTVLPEIEMPGHSEAAIFAYPELGCQDSTGAKHRVRMLDPSENTFTFLENVLTEVIALFPNPYIHIGGDEAEMVDWLKSPVAVALMKREGLKSEKEVQSYFIKRIEKFLLSKNKKLIGWDEILQGGLAQSATVMSWQGEAGGIAAAKMHHPVVMTPLPQMYFDAPQANEELEPIGWNPTVTWQMVYNYEPLSKELNPAEAAYILGAQGNIWVEKIPNLRHLEYMVFPRALAVAELSWSAKGDKNMERFGYKLNKQYNLFKLWNLNARIPDISGVVNVVTNKDHFTTTLNSALKGVRVHYSLNGVMPDSTSSASALPVQINVPLKDTLVLSTYTDWVVDHQHIKQKAFIQHVDIKPVTANTGNLKPGLTYALYKTKESNYNKLDSISPVTSGVLTLPQALTPSDEEGNNWVKVNGYIEIKTEGDYELTSGFEKSPELLVDDKKVISMDKNLYAEPQKALLHLAKGYYAIKGYYLATDANNSEELLQLKTSSGKTLPPATYLFHQ